MRVDVLGLFEFDRREVVRSPGEVNVFGRGDLIEHLTAAFPDGWYDKIAERGARALFEQIFVHGIFHASSGQRADPARRRHRLHRPGTGGPRGPQPAAPIWYGLPVTGLVGHVLAGVLGLALLISILRRGRL